MVIARRPQAAFNESLSFDPQAPNTSPPSQWYTAVGTLLSDEWEGTITGHREALDVSDMMERASGKATTDATWLEILAEHVEWGADANEQLVRYAIDHFVKADLFHATSEFMAHSHGSFGIRVVSTTDPGCLVVCAKGAPMHLSFDLEAGIVISASETRAADVPITASKEHNAAADVESSSNEGTPSTGRFTLRLASKMGQVIEVRTLKCRRNKDFASSFSTNETSSSKFSSGSIGWPDRFALRSFDVYSGAETLPDDLLGAVRPQCDPTYYI